jgi:hypothetical protein
MSKWFVANKLVINPDKTNTVTYITNSSPQHSSNTGYSEKYIGELVNTKFIGNHLNWKDHIDKLVPKLRGAHYAIISMLHISNTNTLR